MIKGGTFLVTLFYKYYQLSKSTKKEEREGGKPFKFLTSLSLPG